MSVPEELRLKRRALLDALAKAGAEHATPGPSAARSQDFLYDELGLPLGWDSFLTRNEVPWPEDTVEPPGVSKTVDLS